MNNRKASARTAGSVGPAIDFQASETSSLKVVTTGGHTTPISQPLVGTRPSTGWRVPVKLKDLSYTVNGVSAHDAFNKVQSYLIKNGVMVEPVNIWFHLNLYWLPKVIASKRRASVQALNALKRESKDAVIEREGYGPPHYGSIHWALAGLYLVVPEKEYTEQGMREIYDPWATLFLSSPSIGCEECLEHWNEAYAKADLSTRTKARDFFVNIQNEIRARQERPALSFADQAKTHLWTLNL